MVDSIMTKVQAQQFSNSIFWLELERLAVVDRLQKWLKTRSSFSSTKNAKVLQELRGQVTKFLEQLDQVLLTMPSINKEGSFLNSIRFKLDLSDTDIEAVLQNYYSCQNSLINIKAAWQGFLEETK